MSDVPKRRRRAKRPAPAHIVKLNAERRAARLAREREERIALAKEARIARNEALPEGSLEAAALRMDLVPDANPVKAACLAGNHDPLATLVQMASSQNMERKLKIDLNKYLVDKLIPNLRALDIQKRSDINVNVTITSFIGVDPEEMRKREEKYVDADYEEFIEV